MRAPLSEIEPISSGVSKVTRARALERFLAAHDLPRGASRAGCSGAPGRSRLAGRLRRRRVTGRLGRLLLAGV